MKLAVKNISAKGIRSYLTMTGIFIGIATVVSLISIGYGLQDSMNEQFNMMGANTMTIMPGGGLGEISSFGAAASKLTQHDLDIINKVEGVEVAGGMTMKICKIKFKDDVKYLWVAGIPADESQSIFLDMMQIRVAEGQKKFREGDKYESAVGYLIGKGDTFGKNVKLKDKIFIDGQEFKVDAVMDQIGNPQDDSTVWIQSDTSKELFKDDNFYIIFARAKEGSDSAHVADEVKKALRKDRNQEEGDEDFSVQTSEQLKETINTTLGIVSIFIIGLAGVSLLVGVVGIMNTMYTSVLERTREIGLMKAVGAKNSDVLMIFLMESGILGLIGGAIGCFIGVFLSKSVELIAETQNLGILKAWVAPELIIGVLAFSFIIGCLSGLLPARQAAKLKPVDALRYE